MTKNISKKQRRLATLLKGTSGIIRIDDAAATLDIDREHAAKLLAGWHNQGALRRVARGLYVPIQPPAIEQTQVLEDPWILVPVLYEPGYVGGWSALEYWELTEQLFKSVCVLTSRRTTYGEVKHQGVNFYVKRVPEKQQFATQSTWHDSTRIQISNPHKTMLDVVGDVYLGAGVQHTVDCLAEFKKRFDTREDLERLLEYTERMQNGALYKKLGFLAERLEFDEWFVQICQTRITKGYTFLDNNKQENNLNTRWHLWVPKGLHLDR